MKYCIVAKNDEISLGIKNKFLSNIEISYDSENPDIIISIGGDGTILKALHKYHKINPNIIIFGIHTGHLGFYANYSIDDIDDIINSINNNEISFEVINLLTCKVKTNNEEFTDFALNEITVINPPRTLLLDVYIDGECLEHYRGTGICVSTPSGSTAYNKSLHGSVIDNRLKTMQLTEIAGINSNAYRTLSSPLVLSENREILLKMNSDCKVWVTIDNSSHEIDGFIELTCKYSGSYIKMAYSTEQIFIKRIKRTFI